MRWSDITQSMHLHVLSRQRLQDHLGLHKTHTVFLFLPLFYLFQDVKIMFDYSNIQIEIIKFIGAISQFHRTRQRIVP